MPTVIEQAEAVVAARARDLEAARVLPAGYAVENRGDKWYVFNYNIQPCAALGPYTSKEAAMRGFHEKHAE